MMNGCCELCGREVSELTDHHLIPRTRQRNRRVQREFDRKELKAVARLCRACHNFLHANFTEKTLERAFRTLDALRAHPDVARFVAWIRGKPPEFHAYTRDARKKH